MKQLILFITLSVLFVSPVVMAHDTSSSLPHLPEVSSLPAGDPTGGDLWAPVDQTIGFALYDAASSLTYSNCRVQQNGSWYDRTLLQWGAPSWLSVDLNVLRSSIYRRMNGRQPLYRSFSSSGDEAIEVTTDAAEHTILSVSFVKLEKRAVNFGADFAHPNYRTVVTSRAVTTCLAERPASPGVPQ